MSEPLGLAARLGVQCIKADRSLDSWLERWVIGRAIARWGGAGTRGMGNGNLRTHHV